MSALGLASATEECQRLDLQHQIWKHAGGGQLVWAPVDLKQTPIRILDSAGANGTWLLDVTSSSGMAVDHAGSDFISADIDPLKFASQSEQKRHIQFLEHSFTEPWPDRLHGMFDLVHQRLAMPAAGKVPPSDAVRYFSALLKPGTGWLQLVEYDTGPDPTAAADDPMEDFKRLLNAVTMATGTPEHSSRHLAENMTNAGLMDVQQHYFNVYYGKEFGGKEELIEPSIQGLVSFSKRFCKLAEDLKVDIPHKVVEDLPDRLEKHLREHGGHVEAVAVCGRRTAAES